MRTLKILIMILPLFFLLNLFKIEKAEAGYVRYVIRVKINNCELIIEDGNRQEIKRYLVAVPASIKPHYPLPLVGKLKSIELNPIWYPTAKTRAAYLKEKGVNLPVVVKPGDSRNAMGAAKFIFEFKNWKEPIRLHGTNEPSLIGRRVTRGCIRMHNLDILELAEIIKNSGEGEIKIIIEK